MSPSGNRLLAALTIIAFAILFTVIGVTLSNADEPKAPDFSELRGAINAAAKRGENVDEIRKALDALQKSLSNSFTELAPGKTKDPSPELSALRDMVEAAAKKGENVEEINRQLEVVEKLLTGKSQSRPKPLPPAELPNDPLINPNLPNNRPRINPQLAFPGNAIDPEAMEKANELSRKASELMLKNPADPEARKLMQQAHDAMMQALLGGKRLPAPQLIFPDIGGGRVGEKFRLGVRLERISELAADQLGLEVARGVGIADVVEGSAAQKAGFKAYDIVLEFAGKAVSDNPEEFTRLVASVKGGEKIDALIMRKGKKLEIKGIVLPDQAMAIQQPIPFDGFQVLPELNPVPRPENRGKAGNSVSYSVNNGQVVIKAWQDGVQFVIYGEPKEDAFVTSRIVITDGEKKTDVEKFERVPEEYKRAVEELLKGIKGRKILSPEKR